MPSRFKNKRVYLAIVFLGIFLIALFFRLYRLSEFPIGFHIDEASLGYNGYSLLLTGKDDNNHAWPLYIDIFGDNRPSGYHYLTILPIILFGLTEFATRLPGALIGSFTIFTIAFLSWVLFRNLKISILSSLLLSIAPWHVVLSRASAETIVALFFIILGFALVIFSIEKKRILYLIGGVLCLCISFFFYHTPRVFVPSFFIFIFILFFQNFWPLKKNRFTFAFIGSFLFVSCLALALVFSISGGTGRFNQVNIFGHPETRLVMEEQLREDGSVHAPLLETRLIHNKITNYFMTFTKNYLTYFSGDFLFIEGGKPIWYDVPNMGLIYLIELPFFLLGILYLAIHKKISYKFPIFWLFAAPLTASITIDDIPNIQRAIVMFPMIELIAAYGFITYISQKQKNIQKIMFCFVGFFLLYNVVYFYHQYFVHTKTHRTWYRNNGQKELMGFIKQQYDAFDRIVVTKATGGIYPLVLFYMQFDPKQYQAEGSTKDKEYTGFGKFFFVPQMCPSTDKDSRFPKDKKIMYINLGDCKDNAIIQYKDIDKEDGTRAFRIDFGETL